MKQPNTAKPADGKFARRLVRRNVIAFAERHLGDKYPQYAGLWSGAEWRVARIRTDIKTKLGVAFVAGELTIARERSSVEVANYPELAGTVVAFSVKNICNTAVAGGKVVFLESAGGSL